MRGDVVYCQKLDNDRFLRRIEVSKSGGRVVFFAGIQEVNQLTRRTTGQPQRIRRSKFRIGRGRKTKISLLLKSEQLVAPGVQFRNQGVRI